MKNAKSNPTHIHSFFARLSTPMPKLKKAPKASKLNKSASGNQSSKKANSHGRNKKASRLIIAVYPWLLGVALFAAILLLGVSGSLLYCGVTCMAKAFTATAAKVFAPKVVAIVGAAAATVTAVLWYRQQKRRVMHEAVYGKVQKTGKYAKFFAHHPVIFGAAFFGGLMLLGLVIALLAVGSAAINAAAATIISKVFAPKVIAITAAICLCIAVAIWYRRKKAIWAKQARRRAYAQAAAKAQK